MHREYKTVTLPSGVIVELHTYLTAGESNAIKAIMMAAMKIDIADLKPGVTGDELNLKGQIDGTILMEQEKLRVNYLVKTCEGGVENLRASDYEAILAEINKITGAPLAVPK